MKKLLLLCLAVAGYVSTMSAATPLEFHFNGNTYWTGSESYLTFTDNGVNPDNDKEEIYTLTLNSSNGLGDGDIYFRLHYNGYNDDMGPTTNQEFSFANGDITNALDLADIDWSNTKYIKIPQSTIKASEYKITVYGKSDNKCYIVVDIASMPLTISDDSGYATFSCDRALDFSTAGVTAYVASAPADGRVSMVPVSGNVPANTGLFIVGAASATSYKIPVVTTSAASTWNQLNYLHPTTGSGIAAGNYVFARQNDDVGFYPLGESTVIPKGKAYLDYDSPASNGGLSRLTISFDNASAISSVKSANAEDTYFDLQGRRVAQPTKGLYIINGKKVIK